MLDKHAPALLKRAEDSSEVRPPHGVMEGKGAYNEHAKTQAAGAALATPFLENAIEKIDLGQTDQPVVVADYGPSQGKNSLAPLRIAIRTLRKRIGPSRPIMVSSARSRSTFSAYSSSERPLAWAWACKLCLHFGT